MSDNKIKKDVFTFFNEEWNEPSWEDGVDVITQRNNKPNSVIED